MKRVAFLSFDWDYEVVSAYYRGMQAYVQGCTDLQLVIFSAFGHYYVNHEPVEGSFEIFSLCELSQYDAFIVQGNRTWPPELRQDFVNQAIALGKPALSINYELDGAYYVGTNNYDAMYGLVDKVLCDRACTNPLFVNGLATSVEAQERAHAYQDACAAHGLESPGFLQANWQFESGISAAQLLLEHRDALPEVVFCCNDDLAVGLMETLQANGVRIPEDLMVTGFDHREMSLRTTPYVTTIDRDYFTTGQTSIDVVRRLLEGQDVPRRNYSPVQYALTMSCSYPEESISNYTSDLFSLDNSLKQFYETLGNFQTAVLSVDSLFDIMCVCEKYAADVRCPNVYLSINDRYLHGEAEQSAGTYGPVSHLMACYGDAFLRPHDSKHIYASYLTAQLLPSEVPMDSPVYAVYPVHHNKTCIGTIVTEGVSPIVNHGFFTFFITLLSGSIETAQKKELLNEANNLLDNLYVHDELTSLFNRFGLDRFGDLFYQRLLECYGEAQFIFVDIDDMKKINDECGHDMGDCALRDTADIIRRATDGEDAFSMRYGGDEFLLISRYDLKEKLEAELELLKDSVLAPYDLQLSIGPYRVRTDDHLSMRDAIQLADGRMYEIKKARKARRD